MQNYKKLGIEHFYRKDFKTVKIYFSLAYKKRKNKHLLSFIGLCDLALKSQKEAFLLFDFYLQHYKMHHIEKDFEKILASVELKEEQNVEFEDGYALNYQDFLKSEEKIGFKKSFENVVSSGKLVIDNKEDFLEFLEKLLDNGYKDMTLNYIENASAYFWTNEKFIKLQKKLIGLKGDFKA